jgi:hypothetical protein
MGKEVKELVVIDKVTKTGKDVDSLEKLISRLPEVPTEELVTGFRLVNSYSKKMEQFVDAVKKELVDNKEQTGRFLTEGIPDEKGHLYLSGVEDDELKAERRVYAKFNEEKAAELLKEKGLFELGSDTVVDCKDPAHALDLVQEALEKLRNGEGVEDAIACMNELKDLFEVNYVASEPKVEALVALGKIDSSEVAQVMDVSIQYAVKEVKAKKK